MMSVLDDTASPKHEQLRLHLLDFIASLELGTRLPAERELSTQLGVSRETLRRTLDELEQDGHVERRRGAGTFVSQPRITKRFHLVSFTEDMQQRGLVPSSRVLSSHSAPAGSAIGSRLRISPADLVLWVRRLRLADGEPMAIEDLAVPVDLVPGLKAEELEGESFYAVLAARYGFSVSQGSQTIESTVLEQDEADLLNVAQFSPALLVKRTTAMPDGRPVEHVASIYRGDRYRFEVDLTARRAGVSGR